MTEHTDRLGTWTEFVWNIALGALGIVLILFCVMLVAAFIRGLVEELRRW